MFFCDFFGVTEVFSVVAEVFSGWRRGSFSGWRRGFSDEAGRKCSAGRRIGSGLPPAQHKSIAGGCLLPGARRHSAGQSLNHATQVWADSAKTAHTWKQRMPQRAMQGRLAVQVAANSPKTAHTRKQRTSVMSPGRSCDGGPPSRRTESGLLVYGMPSQDRAVQNQASCRTGHLRRAIWYDGSSTVQFAVTDNILTQNRLKVLPVPICEQAKPSSACLPPLEWL